MTDERLVGGGQNEVWRRGAVVLREPRPWTKSVHAVLRHLEEQGFDAAPRVEGTGFDEDGRETLGFVEGTTINSAPWPTEAAFVAIGEMVRDLHRSMGSFAPPDDAIWQPWYGRGLGEVGIIGHCDLAPWNIVARDGRPVAFVDWQFAGPVDPLTDLAVAAWANAQLYDDDIAAMHGLADAEERARQVRAVAEAYGLGTGARKNLVERMIEIAILSAANEVTEAGITPETTSAPLWGIAWRTRSAGWLVRHRQILEAALR